MVWIEMKKEFKWIDENLKNMVSHASFYAFFNWLYLELYKTKNYKIAYYENMHRDE